MVLLIVGSVLATLMTAPLLYNALILIGRQVPSLVALRDCEFVRVVSRMVLILVAIGFFPALWLGGVRNASQVGFGRTPGWRRQFACGLGLGLLTILAAAAYLLVTQQYTMKSPSFSDLPGQLFSAFISGIFVALFEEMLFRGVLFGRLRKPLGFFGALLFSSALYGLVHFADPVPAVGVAHAHVTSGFALLSDMFRWPHAPNFYVPAVLTLLLIGFALCGFYARFGSLWFGVGLHMGWIWCLLSLPEFLTAGKDQAGILFSDPANLSKTYPCFIAALVLAVTAAFLSWPRSRGKAK